MTTQFPPAVVILGQNSLPIARQLIEALPGATLYGLASRTADVVDLDVAFDNFGDTLRELFSSGTPIVGICAAGILIRTLAPLLSDKRAEPPVLAIAEDGSAVVPLLGGLNGVNDLARQIAAALEVQAAITTTGEVRFGRVLENPPPGYRLANPEQAKSFTSDLLAGVTVRLDGNAPWLDKLPIASDGRLTIQITDHARSSTPTHLVYHPATIAIGIGNTAEIDAPALIDLIQQQLNEASLASESIAGVFALTASAANPVLPAIAQAFNVPLRFFTPAQLVSSDPSAAALQATHPLGALIPCCSSSFALARSPHLLDPASIGQAQGRLAIVGTGPGSAEWMSPQVRLLLQNATDLVGYKTYLDLVGALAAGKRQHESDNREELSRAEMALDLAAEGRSVVVVSSGDPGIYAMAAAVFEALEQKAKPEWNSIEIQVAPGISAMQAAAAAIGAPLGHDFCAISLSDILKPWSAIEQRIAAAAAADFVIAFYNPVSKQRTWQLAAAQQILLKARSPHTPVILAQNLGRAGQQVKVLTLEQLSPEEANMRTTVLVGSTQTRIVRQGDRTSWVYTPRYYSGK